MLGQEMCHVAKPDEEAPVGALGTGQSGTGLDRIVGSQFDLRLFGAKSWEAESLRAQSAGRFARIARSLLPPEVGVASSARYGQEVRIHALSFRSRPALTFVTLMERRRRRFAATAEARP